MTITRYLSPWTQAKDLKNQEKNITTMKRYIKPTSDIVEIETSPILDGSMYIGKDDETVDPDGSDQLAGGHRDSWDTIWDSMNSSNWETVLNS